MKTFIFYPERHTSLISKLKRFLLMIPGPAGATLYRYSPVSNYILAHCVCIIKPSTTVQLLPTLACKWVITVLEYWLISNCLPAPACEGGYHYYCHCLDNTANNRTPAQSCCDRRDRENPTILHCCVHVWMASGITRYLRARGWMTGGRIRRAVLK